MGKGRTVNPPFCPERCGHFQVPLFTNISSVHHRPSPPLYVVDQDVKTTEPGYDLVNKGGDLVCIKQVCPDNKIVRAHLFKILLHLPQRFLPVVIVQRHLDPFSGQGKPDPFPNPLDSAQYQCHFSLEFHP